MTTIEDNSREEIGASFLKLDQRGKYYCEDMRWANSLVTIKIGY
jgi:hypothetical protein